MESITRKKLLDIETPNDTMKIILRPKYYFQRFKLISGTYSPNPKTIDVFDSLEECLKCVQHILNYAYNWSEDKTDYNFSLKGTATQEFKHGNDYSENWQFRATKIPELIERTQEILQNESNYSSINLDKIVVRKM